MKASSLFCLGLLTAALLCAQTTTTDELLRNLSNPEKQVRLSALRDLSRLTPADRIVFAITAALGDDDESVRAEAASSLARIGADAISAAPELLRALQDSSVNVQSSAARALGKMRAGGDAALPRLRLLATERRYTVRSTVAEALALIGANRGEVIRLLEILLKDSEESVRRNALYGLISLYSPAETVAFVTRVLQGDDPKLRLGAFAKLRDITHLAPAATPMIVQGLDDADPQVQYAAINAVWGIRPPPPGVLEGLSRIVGDDKAWIRNRIRAAHTVGTFGEQASVAVRALTAALDINHPAFQGTARQALVRIGADPGREAFANWNNVGGGGIHSAPLPNPEELDQWIADLSGPDIQRRYAVVEDLAAVGPVAAKAAPALANALRDGFMRYQVIEALQNIGEPAVSALTPLLNDPDPAVRRDALSALSRPGRNAGPEASAALAQAAQSLFEDVRSKALERLASMRRSPQIAVPALLSALETPSTRVFAIHALMSYSGQAEVIVPALSPLLKDSDPLVVGATARLLHVFQPQGQAVLPELVDALDRTTGEPRDKLIETLVAVADATPQSVEVLFAALEGSSARSRAQITRALTVIGSANPRPDTFAVVLAKLTQLLTDSASEVRHAALSAVHRIGADAATARPTVEALLGDPSYEVRAQAIRTLTVLANHTGQTERAAALIMTLLNDPHDEVRESAAFQLGASGMAGDDALPALSELLDDPSKKVRDAAAFALRAVTGNLPKQL